MNLNADSQQRFQADGCTVHDRLSGLDWMQDLAPAGWPRFWNEALDFIADLNDRLHLDYNACDIVNLEPLLNMAVRELKGQMLGRVGGLPRGQDQYDTAATGDSLLILSLCWSARQQRTQIIAFPTPAERHSAAINTATAVRT